MIVFYVRWRMKVFVSLSRADDSLFSRHRRHHHRRRARVSSFACMHRKYTYTRSKTTHELILRWFGAAFFCCSFVHSWKTLLKIALHCILSSKTLSIALLLMFYTYEASLSLLAPMRGQLVKVTPSTRIGLMLYIIRTFFATVSTKASCSGVIPRRFCFRSSLVGAGAHFQMQTLTLDLSQYGALAKGHIMALHRLVVCVYMCANTTV